MLDDCWSAETRDANGRLQPDPSRFPDGMYNLNAYVNSLGLKLGLYTCAGANTCKYNRPGSEGYYDVDAETFASWRISAVKADNCFTNHSQAPREYYANFSHYLNATGWPMLFEICVWGEDDVESWGMNVGQTFRINNDHLPLWSFNGQGTADLIEKMAQVGNASVPYGYADPDFLYTGIFTLSSTESETEFAFWSIFNGPMLFATDPRNMSDWLHSVLMNKDIIDINQDDLMTPGFRIRVDNGTETQVWMKPLANMDIAVILYNKNDWINNTVSMTWDEIGWSTTDTVQIYDLWSHSILTNTTNGYSGNNIPPHGHVYWRLTKLA